MTKELFIKSIEAIENQYMHDDAFASNMEKCFPEAFIGNLLPDNHYLSTALLEILKVEMNENYDYSLIEYFINELDFGKNNYRLKVWDKDNKEIPMRNSEDLWNILIKGK